MYLKFFWHLIAQVSSFHTFYSKKIQTDPGKVFFRT